MNNKPLRRYLQHRYNTAEGWTEENPVLLIAEMGMETGTNRIKMGDGYSTWTQLPYFGGGTTQGDDIDGGSFQSNGTDPDILDGGGF